MKKSFSIISLGCFRNTYDSEVIAKRFLDRGYFAKEDYKDCNTLVINTCGFIDKAKEESLGVIEEAVRLKNKGRIKKLFVFGCLVERYSDELKRFFPHVDQWQGVEKFDQKFAKRKNLLPKHIDFLKICEGCFNKCSYCAIPLIKGGLRSKSKEEVIKEAKFLDQQGIKELNIIGQDITSWAKDIGGKEDLASLLKAIIKETKNIHWIRLIYTHPRHITDALIDLVRREERISKYIDLPIQHINDRILKLMNRGVTKKETISLIKRIRKNIPNCAIRTSVIVGFPTEREEEFKELLDFLKEVEFERLGAFIYSREENTKAYNFSPQINNQTKTRRFRELMTLQQSITRKLNSKFLGKEMEVLVEGKDNDVFVGRTQYDAYDVDGVVFLRRKGLRIGNFYKTEIVDTYDYDLVGI
jgi:ribosomal protein S12 methylthiotransferase